MPQMQMLGTLRRDPSMSYIAQALKDGWEGYRTAKTEKEKVAWEKYLEGVRQGEVARTEAKEEREANRTAEFRTRQEEREKQAEFLHSMERIEDIQAETGKSLMESAEDARRHSEVLDKLNVSNELDKQKLDIDREKNRLDKQHKIDSIIQNALNQHTTALMSGDKETALAIYKQANAQLLAIGAEPGTQFPVEEPVTSTQQPESKRTEAPVQPREVGLKPESVRSEFYAAIKDPTERESFKKEAERWARPEVVSKFMGGVGDIGRAFGQLTDYPEPIPSETTGAARPVYEMPKSRGTTNIANLLGALGSTATYTPFAGLPVYGARRALGNIPSIADESGQLRAKVGVDRMLEAWKKYMKGEQ